VQRVLILGGAGAGKSTLARRLGEATGLPVIHLDAHFWQPGWVETPDEEWDAKAEQLSQREAWIIDGNYSRTMPARLAACDTVIFLDFPLRTCLWSVVKRRIRYHGRTRPDLARDCPEMIDWEFLQWVWGFRRHNRPKIIELLQAHGRHKELILLRNRREVERFLQQVALC
jgi:adenylate kinase family enzyme